MGTFDFHLFYLYWSLMNIEKFALSHLNINVSADHRFGTDAFLLAGFAKPKRKDIVCDLCTGCGIIPLLFCKKDPPQKIYAIDIQEEAIDLLKMSIADNNLDNIIEPVLCDLKTPIVPRETIDMVTVNPPYFVAQTGLERLSKAQAIARHELLCSLDDVVKAADFLLKYGGTLKMCHVPDRLCDVMCAMRKYKIEPKIITFVQNKEGDQPWLFLISGKKGGKSGLKITKPLNIREGNEYTKEILSNYE